MNVIAYIDEAGAKGFSRKLSPDRDHEIGLMAAILYPADRVDEMREAYRPGFDAFCAAAPEGEKHHFTDAFRPGNEAWAVVAREVRSEFKAIIQAQTPPIVYEARRLVLQREAHGRRETLKAEARAARANTAIRAQDRQSNDRVEGQLVQGMTTKLDDLALQMNWEVIDLWFDEIDEVLADHYRGLISKLRTLSSSTGTVKGWDTVAKTPVSASYRFNIHTDFQIDVTRIGDIRVVGKSDPLILVADMVANGLHRHLKALSSSSSLNAPDSVAGWSLNDRIFGLRDDAIEDSI